MKVVVTPEAAATLVAYTDFLYPFTRDQQLQVARALSGLDGVQAVLTNEGMLSVTARSRKQLDLVDSLMVQKSFYLTGVSIHERLAIIEMLNGIDGVVAASAGDQLRVVFARRSLIELVNNLLRRPI